MAGPVRKHRPCLLYVRMTERFILTLWILRCKRNLVELKFLNRDYAGKENMVIYD